MRALTKTILLAGIILPCIIGIWSCKGGKIPELGDISGPVTVDEYGYVEYSVSLTNASDATFLWSCDPANAGKFDNPDLPKTGFTASMVTQDLPVKISIIIENQQFEPVILSKSITVRDTGPYGWVRTWGGNRQDSGSGVVIDGSGNAYVTGSFEDTLDFDPGPGVNEQTSNGAADIFLSKFDSDGYFQWVRSWGGALDDYGGGVEVDTNGNTYVTGCFEGTVDFDPGLGVNEHTSYGDSDIYLGKFDSNGEFQWARTWGGNSGDTGPGVAIDGSGNIYSSGVFRDTVDFDPGPGVEERTSLGYFDIFLSKFDSSGEFQWVRTWSGEGVSLVEVAVDYGGNTYVTGHFGFYMDFDPGPEIEKLTSNGNLDVFLVTLDSDGEYRWAHNWGGPYNDKSYGVAAEGGGNVYVTGLFSSSVDFDPGPEEHEYTSNGNSDIFLSKFDTTGNFQWARTWGGDGWDKGYGVTVDTIGNPYVTGLFPDIVDFDPGPGIDEHVSNGFDDIFLSMFDTTGNFQWARTWGGNGEYDYCCEVTVDGCGYAYVTGYFMNIVDFDPGPGVDEHTSNGYEDIFLSKFPPDGNW